MQPQLPFHLAFSLKHLQLLLVGVLDLRTGSGQCVELCNLHAAAAPVTSSSSEPTGYPANRTLQAAGHCNASMHI